MGTGTEITRPTTTTAAVMQIYELGFRIDPDGLTIREGADVSGLSLEAYELIGYGLGLFRDAWQWAVGDWVLLGEALFGEEAANVVDTDESRRDEVLRVTGIAPGYLQNIVRQCERIPGGPNGRRRTPPLEFSTHYPVIPLEPDAQVYWLGKAVENRWGKAELAAAIKASQTPATDDDEDDDAGGSGDGDGLTIAERIEKAARLCWHQGQVINGEARVSVEYWSQLGVALGEE